MQEVYTYVYTLYLPCFGEYIRFQPGVEEGELR